MSKEGVREGSLEAPTRHPLAWRDEQFYDQNALDQELERVFDICHGCRRCVNLCNAFPTLFDLVDESETMEVDGVDKADYNKVVEQCYLCDLCYLTKCPYVPPHEWNVDFPHLMLRAKAVQFKKQGAPLKNKMMASTDLVGSLAGIPVVAEVVNTVNRIIDQFSGGNGDTSQFAKHEDSDLLIRLCGLAQIQTNLVHIQWVPAHLDEPENAKKPPVERFNSSYVVSSTEASKTSKLSIKYSFAPPPHVM